MVSQLGPQLGSAEVVRKRVDPKDRFSHVRTQQRLQQLRAGLKISVLANLTQLNNCENDAREYRNRLRPMQPQLS